ncbi:MAG: hypothetical protein WA728_33490 [Xanthobacteraceae bacterium]
MSATEVLIFAAFIAIMALQALNWWTWRLKNIKQTKKTKWYPTDKKIKPSRDNMERLVDEFVAKGGQITKCVPGTKKP